ncbi:FAD-dependent oxidoreductase [uncultured Legionella sp.]|uniref:FAD-dependent oxidoreductase n=1 Tax=uncultured Legionella sp. TaxID=210934 RepID=UPI0026144D71|nr:FAD-dependent oxidoreductase [uncultured Legionella sp.]
MLINGYNESHMFVEQGMIEFINRLFAQPVKTNIGLTSLKQQNCVHLNTAILSLDYNHHSNRPMLRGKHTQTNESFEREYDAIIYTGTSSAAYLLNLSNVSENGVFLFNSDERRAIRNSYMIPSSKTFILTADKFWKKQNIPSCILTDELPKVAYFIDHPNVNEGVICLSYAWGVDSLRLNALEPAELVVMFLSRTN